MLQFLLLAGAGVCQLVGEAVRQQGGQLAQVFLEQRDRVDRRRGRQVDVLRRRKYLLGGAGQEHARLPGGGIQVVGLHHGVLVAGVGDVEVLDGRGREGGDAAIPLDDLRQPQAPCPVLLVFAEVERGVGDQVDVAADHPGGHVRGPGDGERVQQLRVGLVRRVVDGHGHALGLVDRRQGIDAGRCDARRGG